MKMTKPARKRLKVFFRFLQERQLIWERRLADKPFPWTKDKVLQENKFTNIYRELDRGTIYWFREVLALSREWDFSGSELMSELDPVSVLFHTCIYRLINRISTFDWIEGHSKFYSILPGMSDRRLEGWIESFLRAPDPKFTGAHIVAYGAGKSKQDGFLEALDYLYTYADDMMEQINECDSLVEVWRVLQQVGGIGGFIGYEIVCDLMYAEVIDPELMNTWCNPGPGCIQGTNILITGDRAVAGLKGRDEYIEFCIWLQQNQHDLMRKCGIKDFPFWNGEHVEGVWLCGKKGELSLRSIEHSLCEFQKYWRCTEEGGKAKNRYTETDNGVN